VAQTYAVSEGEIDGMDESNVVDLLPLIAERVLQRAAEMRLYASRIEREFGGDRNPGARRGGAVSAGGRASTRPSPSRHPLEEAIA
jgi:hypothetical protein